MVEMERKLPHDEFYPNVGAKPNRPNQIFGYPGDNVKINMHTNGIAKTEVVVLKQLNEQQMRIVFADTRERDVFMADWGLIPYDIGKWNQRNWCEYV